MSKLPMSGASHQRVFARSVCAVGYRGEELLAIQDGGSSPEVEHKLVSVGGKATKTLLENAGQLEGLVVLPDGTIVVGSASEIVALSGSKVRRFETGFSSCGVSCSTPPNAARHRRYSPRFIQRKSGKTRPAI